MFATILVALQSLVYCVQHQTINYFPFLDRTLIHNII